MPLDRRGRIHENDARALREWGKQRDALFATDLARGAKASANNARGNDPRFAPGNVVDGNGETSWASDDQARTPELIFDLPHPATFDAFRIGNTCRWASASSGLPSTPGTAAAGRRLPPEQASAVSAS